MECVNEKTEKSELAQMLYIQGQTMERLLHPKEDILKVQEEAIELEEAAQTEGKPKTPKLAKLYKIKAALLESMGHKVEAIVFYQNAVDILRENDKEQEAEFIELHSKKLDLSTKVYGKTQGNTLEQQESDEEVV